MTKEAAKREIDSLDFYLQNHTDDYGESSHTAMMMAAKALETENALIDRILEIIDGYKSNATEPVKLSAYTYNMLLDHMKHVVLALKGGE